MKHLIFSLFALFIHFHTVAQTSEPLVVTVSYDFIHVYDTANRTNPVVEKMGLYVGQTSSCFRRGPVAGVIRAAATSAAPIARTGEMITVKAVALAVVNAPFTNDAELFQQPAAGTLNACTHLGMVDYLVEGKLPVIPWKVGSATRTIGDYTCQQATGTYAGRMYTAWFAPDLPFRNGPWKLSGLPGLILEARDATGDVAFVFTGFVKADSGQVTAYPKRKLITTSDKALKRLRDAFDDNPVAAMQAQMPADATPPSVAYREASGRMLRGEEAQAMIDKKKAAKKTLNNPLELTP